MALLIDFRVRFTDYSVLLTEYRARLTEYRALLGEHAALLIDYRALCGAYIWVRTRFFIVYDSIHFCLANNTSPNTHIQCLCKPIAIDFGVFVTTYKALLIEYRSLLAECRAFLDFCCIHLFWQTIHNQII